MTSEQIEEIQTALKALRERIGSYSNPGIMIHVGDVSANAYFSSRGFVGEDFTRKVAKTPLEAIKALSDEWDRQKESRRTDQIRNAALSIIRITYEHGECTDAALRVDMEGILSGDDIAEAVEMANEMADGGPFKVVAVRGANAA